LSRIAKAVMSRVSHDEQHRQSNIEPFNKKQSGKSHSHCFLFHYFLKKKMTEANQESLDKLIKKQFSFHGSPIHYVTGGTGETVIFIHNGGTSHCIWTPVMLDLMTQFHVVALDLPGFGESAMPESGFDLNKYVELLEAFIDEHQFSQVRFVGNCMGSAISLLYSQRHPEKVKGLVLINPLTFSTYSHGWLGFSLHLREWLPGVFGFIVNQLSQLKLSEWMLAIPLRFQLGSLGSKKQLYKDEDLKACYLRPPQMSSLLMILKDIDTYQALDTLEPSDDFPPRCTIWGLENRVLSPEAGRRLNQTICPTQEEWGSGCGHLPMLEDPEEVGKIIREFFLQ
jgi:pimeloyl-ACP methyl ester carboxylesterase